MISFPSALRPIRSLRPSAPTVLARSFAPPIVLLLVLAVAAPLRGESFALEPGQRIAILGNTLGERMQHDGWLETLLQSRFPEHELVFRNLAFSADELNQRLRSEGFGSPDEWLERVEADVVFAFFGFNESFAGPEGLDAFRNDLTRFIRHTREQNYSGRGPARLVLFTPIAHEDLGDPNLPDGSKNNERIARYAAAMAEVAREHDVPLVDLFAPSQSLYEQSDQPLTINGIHLNPRGNHQIATAIDAALFGERPEVETQRLEAIREAVRDKNFYWFHRYRTTDGYSVYGGRSHLKFVDDQTNREVMMREMEVLDMMTANRDRRVWAVARGGELEVDDSNTPPFIEVITNKPGPGPDGEHVFLGGEEAIERMTLGQGLQINLFADEAQFPELVSPVQMAWDPQGRLWVAAWESYPHWKPKDAMDDKLLILEDTTGDGRADQCTVWADGLHNPTGFEFWGGGVLVASAPDLLFLRDTNGDGRCDSRERILHGIDSADTHHAANSFVLGPGGGLYFQEGVFHRTQTETPYGPQRNRDAAVWRFDPRSWQLSRYVPYGFANPHGHVFDRWGQDIVHDGTGAQPYHATLFSGYLPYPDKHPSAPQVYNQRTRPCSGTEILSSRHFPDDFQGNLLVANVIGFHGILRYRLDDAGASFRGEEQEPIVSSSDPNFRPADLEMGPDGALYFIDWQNPIIGHMQHNLRDPSRDRLHGRVYRVTHKDRPLLTPATIAGESIPDLLERLKEPEDRVRYRARLELSARESDEVIAAARQWLSQLDRGDEDFEHHRLEALWLHQQHHRPDEDLLAEVLASPDFRARAAATRVLVAWRQSLPKPLADLRRMAADEHPRVRLEAIRGASFFRQAEAVEVVLVADQRGSDSYLDYTRAQTMRSLQPLWDDALASGREIAMSSEAGERYLLSQLDLAQLLERDRTPAVLRELLLRGGVREELRREAVAGLAQQSDREELAVLLEAIDRIDQQETIEDPSVVSDLLWLLAGRGAEELAEARSDLERLASEARQPLIRQVAFATWIEADGSAEAAWQRATRSPASLRDLVSGVPRISDPGLRAGLYDRLSGLLAGLPEALAAEDADRRGLGFGRYVRIELPRRGTLTLAEVEVYSDGRNVARDGQASQKNTGSGGEASRGIDGNTHGAYGRGGQTHTQENTRDPWWEVDLGDEYPIERIVVYNRTDGDLGKRLDGFTLRVLDAERNDLFRREGIPAPEVSVEFDLEVGSVESVVRRAAMNALISIRGRESQVFESLAEFVLRDEDALAAVRAMQRIPQRFWPPQAAAPLLEVLLRDVEKIPAAERTSPPALDRMELADALASLLPVDRAREVRGRLRQLGVRVLRVGTLPERMAFDQEILAVEAGRPVEFLFENPDLMPHNFLILVPGTLQEVGDLAEATGQQPDAIERQYVPDSPHVLLASRLLHAQQSQRLSFEVPDEPGVYPFVCTYPGHWRRMNGALYVVEDLDQYLADPEGYLAANPLPVRDELLENRRPRTEWTFADLIEDVRRIEPGRSYNTGRAMFTAASCIACHRLGGDGHDLGPNLADHDPPHQPEELLEEIIDPSKEIDEKYQTWSFVTDDGRTVTGLILEEDDQVVKVVEQPLVSREPTVLRVEEIEVRRASPTSMMPKGLLDTLTREEILDLIAYVLAEGKPDHPIFQGSGHDHGSHSPQRSNGGGGGHGDHDH